METTLTLSSRVLKTENVNWRDFKFIQQDSFKDLDPDAAHRLKASILANNFTQPFYVWEVPENGTIFCLDGKHRTLMLEQLIKEGHTVPYLLPATFIHCENKKEAAKLVTIYSSIYARVSQKGLFDFMKEYELDFTELKDQMDLPEFDMLEMMEMLNPTDAAATQAAEARSSLQEKFIIPPFSIFDTRQGYWMDRKRKWIAMGLESEDGRPEELFMAKSGQSSGIYNLRNRMREATGQDPSWDEILKEAKKRGLHVYTGTSIFDPVLTEVVYSWFNIPGGVILDPFAGGSVRGLVASELGFNYIGIDIRPEQVEANIQQAMLLGAKQAEWITGDSSQLNELLPESFRADLIFTCPPYADLEVYSDLEGDLSTMEYDEFLKTYQQIIKQSCGRLKDDRFACFVVGDIRDESGIYRNFVSQTIEAFLESGMLLYNEIILINVAGSLPVRVGRQMANSRKVGKMHQNVLVFYKGDSKKIKENFPEIEVKEMSENA
jgi:DNA modification methylase